MQKYYKLKMSGALRLSTNLICTFSFLPVVTAVLCAWAKLKAQAPGNCDICYLATCPIPWAVLPFFLIVPAVIMFLSRLAPEGYILNDIELVIDRKFKPIVIPLKEITEARPLTDEELKWTLKLTGSGGFYGYFGLFWSKQLGNFNMYATRRKNLVAVRTAKTLYALSPEDTEDFLTTLKKLTGR